MQRVPVFATAFPKLCGFKACRGWDFRWRFDGVAKEPHLLLLLPKLCVLLHVRTDYFLI